MSFCLVKLVVGVKNVLGTEDTHIKIEEDIRNLPWNSLHIIEHSTHSSTNPIRHALFPSLICSRLLAKHRRQSSRILAASVNDSNYIRQIVRQTFKQSPARFCANTSFKSPAVIASLSSQNNFFSPFLFHLIKSLVPNDTYSKEQLTFPNVFSKSLQNLCMQLLG